MMKIGTAAVLGIAATASAQVFNVGSFNVTPGSPIALQFNAPGGNYSDFIFEGDYLDQADPFAYPSDLKINFTSPGGQTYSIGGYDSVVNQWSFQNQTEAGHYMHNGSFGFSDPLSGNWTVELVNDFSFNVGLDWQNVTITFIPAPGAAAVMGMGGLLAMRRRR